MTQQKLGRRIVTRIDRVARDRFEKLMQVTTGNACDAMDRFGAMDYRIKQGAKDQRALTLELQPKLGFRTSPFLACTLRILAYATPAAQLESTSQRLRPGRLK